MHDVCVYVGMSVSMCVCVCVCVCVCACVCVCVCVGVCTTNLVLPGASSLLMEQRDQCLVSSRAPRPPSPPCSATVAAFPSSS